MSSDKRKEQYRRASRKNRERKKEAGLVPFRRDVTEAEKKALIDYLEKLRLTR